MNTLEQKIELLIKEHNLKEKAKALFPNIEHLSFLGFKNSLRIVVNAKNIEDVQHALRTLPPTNNSFELGNDKLLIESPYRITIENPCKYERKATIGYQSNSIDFKIEFPESLIEPFLTSTKRNLYNCEYHYFVGLSQRELNNMQVIKRIFKAPQINFYGGNVVLKDVEEIAAIINFLKKAN